MKNKEKKIGMYLTLKEARAGMRELGIPYSSSFKHGSYIYPEPIYLEPDGSYSIVEPIKSKSVIVEYVDPQNGRRFKKEKIEGRFYYVPMKKAQGFDKLLIRY